jgi:hypothetical protein
MSGVSNGVVDARLRTPHFKLSAFLLYLLYPIPKASMALSVHDSDSDSGSTPKLSKSHAESPEQHGQSEQSGPADSDEDSEVYEIERILDAKRGATGSVCFLKHSLKMCV